MIRARFSLVGIKGNDFRPVIWPDWMLPYWFTGFDGADQPIIVAYAESVDKILELWPEAEKPIDYEHVDRIEFSDRFPEPDWYALRNPIKPLQTPPTHS